MQSVNQRKQTGRHDPFRRMPSAAFVAFAAFAFSLLVTASAFSQEIPAGKRGTLPRDLYTKETMPAQAPVYPTGVPYVYRGTDFVMVAFTTDEDKAAALIPEQLQLIKIPQLPGQASAVAIFANYRGNDQTGPYMEAIVAIPVLYNGHIYNYVPYIYVDNDAALLAGREFGGYPKKMADIEMRNYGSLFLASMSRGTMQKKTASSLFSDIVSLNAKKGGTLFSVPLPAEKIAQLPFPYNEILPLPEATGTAQEYSFMTMGLRRIQGVGSGPTGQSGAEILQLISTPWVVKKATFYAGEEASLEFYPSAEDPIAQQLPINMVLASVIMRADEMMTDANDWKVEVDLLKRP
jgi:Acetoacetate decarboxylase (ADC)